LSDVNNYIVNVRQRIARSEAESMDVRRKRSGARHQRQKVDDLNMMRSTKVLRKEKIDDLSMMI